MIQEAECPHVAPCEEGCSLPGPVAVQLLLAALFLFASLPPATALSTGERVVIAADEVTWVDAAGEFVVVCWGDGTVGFWRWNDAKLASTFKVAGYDYRTTQLCLDSSSLRLAAILSRELSAVIDLYDVRAGTRLKSIKMEKMVGFRGHVFSEDGRLLYGASQAVSAVATIDIEKGEVERRMEPPEEANVGMAILPGLDIIISFGTTEVCARKLDGKFLWRKPANAADALPEPVGVSRAAGAVAVYVDANEVPRIEGWDAATGRKLWGRASDSVSELCAISDDGKTQAFCREQGLAIAHLPDAKTIPVAAIKTVVEGVFSVEGNLLFCLPALQVKAENKEPQSPLADSLGNCLLSKVLQVKSEKPLT